MLHIRENCRFLWSGTDPETMSCSIEDSSWFGHLAWHWRFRSCCSCCSCCCCGGGGGGGGGGVNREGRLAWHWRFSSCLGGGDGAKRDGRLTQLWRLLSCCGVVDWGAHQKTRWDELSAIHPLSVVFSFSFSKAFANNKEEWKLPNACHQKKVFPFLWHFVLLTWVDLNQHFCPATLIPRFPRPVFIPCKESKFVSNALLWFGFVLWAFWGNNHCRCHGSTNKCKNWMKKQKSDVHGQKMQNKFNYQNKPARPRARRPPS